MKEAIRTNTRGPLPLYVVEKLHAQLVEMVRYFNPVVEGMAGQGVGDRMHLI